MAFSVPYGSSSPATPDKSRSLNSNRSTTPPGPPPSSSHSFTPSGNPPPSTIFGSSQVGPRSSLNFSESAFSQSGNFNDSVLSSEFGDSNYALPRTKNGTSGKPFGASQSLFSTTNGSLFGRPTRFGKKKNGYSLEEEEEEEDDAEENAKEEEGEEYDEEEEADDGMDVEDTTNSSNKFGFFGSQFSKPQPAQSTTLGQRKGIYSNPDNAKRPKLDERWANPSPASKPKRKLAPRNKESAIPSIARDLASRADIAMVTEPNNMIIQTEDEICHMYDKARQAEYSEVDFRATLSEVSSKLATIWEASAETESGISRPYAAHGGIGPGEGASKITKSAFLGSLLLPLHHPPLVTVKQGSVGSAAVRAASRSLILSGSNASTYTPIPKVLLDWLNNNHNPQSGDLQSLNGVSPNPTASPKFWDAIQAAILRGRFSEVVEVLHSADFNYARSALEDGLTQPGYRGAQLQNIQRCVNKAIQLLNSCPSVSHNDWDVRGVEWAMYRKRVAAAITDLQEFAEGQGQDQQQQAPPLPPPVENRFQAINFGMTQTSTADTGFSFAQSARMAESRVPWSIYQNLKDMYSIIVGDVSAIMDHAQDWVEATVGLTVWWDGEDDTAGQGAANANDFGASTASNLKRSQFAKSQVPESDDSSYIEDAYLRRLNFAFGAVTGDDETSFRLNTLDSLEVGLACIFENNVEGVLELLQTWSLCVASAVAEVASLGGWFDGATTSTGAGPGAKNKPGGLASFLSENDLMVLSYGQDGPGANAAAAAASSRIRKDDILVAYADGLFGRNAIENETGLREGWEVSLEVLSRLDDTDVMQKKVAELLDKLPLDTVEQMDKVVLLCTELGLDSEGRRVSERYGDRTANESEEYGLALVCYARAHSARKVKSVLDLLTSYCLVQSRAYPAPGDLDEQLRSLIEEPKTCLSAIAAVDDEAARIIQFYFSGYATLRRFYEIRDEALHLKEGQQPRFTPLERKKAAAEALTAVIRSAADSIYGGLYDPNRETALQVDGLLTLLGEATVFVDQPTPLLNQTQQFTILGAIEDLETVTPRVYAQCEECFRSTLIHYHSYERAAPGADDASVVLPPDPRALLRKSVSSLTASSGFSLIGSEMLESHARSRSGSGSAVFVPRPGGGVGGAGAGAVPRGWDWRARLPEDAKGADVLRILRLGLARGLSFGALGSSI